MCIGIKQSDETRMLSALLQDINLDKLEHYAAVDNTTIEYACAELEVEKLQEILKVYTTTEEMFTQKYLHGRNENIKLLVDMGKALEQPPEQAELMYSRLYATEPMYYRCLVEVFRAWYRKTREPPLEVKVEAIL
jgi:hypothetical protein